MQWNHAFTLYQFYLENSRKQWYNIPMIDSHSHLDDPTFDPDRAAVIQRARDSGLKYIVTIGCDLNTSRAAVELADQYDLVYATVGIHPHEARASNDSILDQLRELATHPKVVAWGEIGLDYHYMNSPREVQLQVFRDQIQVALGAGLPLVIHMREAEEDTLALLQKEQADRVGGVFHCFSGDWTMAQIATQMNFMLSISGVVTFPNARRLQEVVKKIPLDQLMIETDCPYLTPVPYRGKRNEPSYVRLVAETITQLKTPTTFETVVTATTENAKRFFKFKKIA
jgi:TatD DNase family protein